MILWWLLKRTYPHSTGSVTNCSCSQMSQRGKTYFALLYQRDKSFHPDSHLIAALYFFLMSLFCQFLHLLIVLTNKWGCVRLLEHNVLTNQLGLYIHVWMFSIHTVKSKWKEPRTTTATTHHSWTRDITHTLDVAHACWDQTITYIAFSCVEGQPVKLMRSTSLSHWLSHSFCHLILLCQQLSDLLHVTFKIKQDH